MILLRLGLAFARVGLLAWGGGQAMIPLMQQECVGAGFTTEAQFLEALAVGNALPGPIAVKMAAVVGWRVEGLLGASVALGAVTLPSVLLMAALMSLFQRFSDNPSVRGALAAARAIAVGMLAWSALELAPAGIRDWRAAILALGAMLALAAKVPVHFVVLAAMIVGAVLLRGPP